MKCKLLATIAIFEFEDTTERTVIEYYNGDSLYLPPGASVDLVPLTAPHHPHLEAE